VTAKGWVSTFGAYRPTAIQALGMYAENQCYDTTATLKQILQYDYSGSEKSTNDYALTAKTEIIRAIYIGGETHK